MGFKGFETLVFLYTAESRRWRNQNFCHHFGLLPCQPWNIASCLCVRITYGYMNGMAAKGWWWYACGVELLMIWGYWWEIRPHLQKNREGSTYREMKTLANLLFRSSKLLDPMTHFFSYEILKFSVIIDKEEWDHLTRKALRGRPWDWSLVTHIPRNIFPDQYSKPSNSLRQLTPTEPQLRN